MSRIMRQDIPYPDVLARVVEQAGFWPGWSFKLREITERGLCLVISVDTVNAYNTAEPYNVTHYFYVPAATHDTHNWSRWLLEQILLVQRHEAMEAFTVNGRRPFPPGHGGGADPYYPVVIY